MIVGIAVETTVDSKDASAVTRSSAKVTARRRLGSKRGGAGDIVGKRSSPSGSGCTRLGAAVGLLPAPTAAEEKRMTDEAQITAANIAKELGVSAGKVKKAIDELKLTPVAKKGVCSYYSRDAVKKIKASLK
jgi:hypothetical protein